MKGGVKSPLNTRVKGLRENLELNKVMFRFVSAERRSSHVSH
jgi:hypothetical protein